MTIKFHFPGAAGEMWMQNGYPTPIDQKEEKSNGDFGWTGSRLVVVDVPRWNRFSRTAGLDSFGRRMTATAKWAFTRNPSGEHNRAIFLTPMRGVSGCADAEDRWEFVR